LIDFAKFPANLFHRKPPIGQLMCFAAASHYSTYTPRRPHLTNDGTKCLCPDKSEWLDSERARRDQAVGQWDALCCRSGTPDILSFKIKGLELFEYL
jgi:hypothetical protein